MEILVRIRISSSCCPPFPTTGLFLDVLAVGALCAPVTAIPPSALPPDGRGVLPLIKPEKTSNNKQRVEVLLLKAREQCSSHQGDTSQDRGSWIISAPSLGFRWGGWRDSASLSPALSLDQVENKDAWPVG